jgi:hypothetical protein
MKRSNTSEPNRAKARRIVDWVAAGGRVSTRAVPDSPLTLPEPAPSFGGRNGQSALGLFPLVVRLGWSGHAINQHLRLHQRTQTVHVFTLPSTDDEAESPRLREQSAVHRA